jgi:antitoxin (DNA-binding transcriptional repressor) of toxin-antitoxin stability system
MIQVTITEAQERLPELLDLVQAGENVEIQADSGQSYILVSTPKHDHGGTEWTGYPKAGSLKGKIWISEDFDEPLEELREYME